MADQAVVNASPLIFLARGGIIEFLQLLSERVVVPLAVAEKIQRRGSQDITVQTLNRTPWLEVTETPPVPPLILAWSLGAGESSVLTWAQAHPGAESILDDLAARRCAAALGLPVRGTLGLVLVAKKRGEISLGACRG